MKNKMKIIQAASEKDIPENFSGIIEWSNGARSWRQNGKVHRLDGPAIELPNREKRYCINNLKLTEKEFEIFQIMWDLTLLERTDELMEVFVGLAKMKI